MYSVGLSQRVVNELCYTMLRDTENNDCLYVCMFVWLFCLFVFVLLLFVAFFVVFWILFVGLWRTMLVCTCVCFVCLFVVGFWFVFCVLIFVGVLFVVVWIFYEVMFLGVRLCVYLLFNNKKSLIKK